VLNVKSELVSLSLSVSLIWNNTHPLYLVKPDATEQEIDQIIDSDDSTQVFTQSVSNTNEY
jgi:hypothetical protein